MQLLELEPRTPVTTISRVLVAAGRPVSVMLDITHPTIELPPLDRLRRDLERGLMVLDVLAELGVRDRVRAHARDAAAARSP